MKGKRISLLTGLLVTLVGLTLVAGTDAEAKTKQAAKSSTQTQKQAAAQTQKQPAAAASIEETFKKIFPDVPFDAIRATEAKGLYEITRGSDIIYFMPDPGYIILGNVIGKDSKNITEARRGELLAAKAKTLPLDKAIKIGSGKNTIIEFTDPDCPYCRRASAFLEQKKDLVTRYVFLFPLPMHSDADNKSKVIFCAEDQGKTFEEVMKGKLDDQKYEKCEKPEAAALLTLHKELGSKMGITGTPYFIVNGKKGIVGANTQQIEAAFVK